MLLTAGDSIILLRRGLVGVVDDADLVNDGTSERRRVGVDEVADRNNVLILSLSIDLSCLIRNLWMFKQTRE
jgi:hypothetical protein